MLIVKIELHSAVTGEIKTVATGKIVNTGTGSPTQGNYRIELRPRRRPALEDRPYRGLPPQAFARVGFAVPRLEETRRRPRFYSRFVSVSRCS
jgi:hypothetical protein